MVDDDTKENYCVVWLKYGNVRLFDEFQTENDF